MFEKKIVLKHTQLFNCITVQYIKYILYKCKHSVANNSLNMQILGYLVYHFTVKGVSQLLALALKGPHYYIEEQDSVIDPLIIE